MKIFSCSNPCKSASLQPMFRTGRSMKSSMPSSKRTFKLTTLALITASLAREVAPGHLTSLSIKEATASHPEQTFQTLKASTLSQSWVTRSMPWPKTYSTMDLNAGEILRRVLRM